MANRTEDNVGQMRSTVDLAALVIQLQTKLNTLRSDFRSHDHGNTASYVQAAITLRGSANTFAGTAEANSASTVPAPAGKIHVS